MDSHARRSRSSAARALVDVAQSSPDLDGFAAQALPILDRSIGIDSGLFVGTETNRFDARWRVDERRARYMDRGKQQIESRYALEVRRAWQAVEQSGGGLDHEIYTLDERQNLPLFREVIRPAGMRSMLLLCARWQGRPLMWIYLNRHGRQAFQRSHLDKALELLPTIEASVMAMRAVGTHAVLPNLTTREHEIARHVARGLTTPQIALILGTSPYTVRNQLGQIFDKARVASRAELASLVARANQTGWQ